MTTPMSFKKKWLCPLAKVEIHYWYLIKWVPPQCCSILFHLAKLLLDQFSLSFSCLGKYYEKSLSKSYGQFISHKTDLEIFLWAQTYFKMLTEDQTFYNKFQSVKLLYLVIIQKFLALNSLPRTYSWTQRLKNYSQPSYCRLKTVINSNIALLSSKSVCAKHDWFVSLKLTNLYKTSHILVQPICEISLSTWSRFFLFSDFLMSIIWP